MATTMQITRQHHPFSLDVREAVVQMHIDGASAKQIASSFGGHPCVSTVRSILHDYEAHGEVLPLNGKKGVLSSTRKFDDVAFETLTDILTDDCQLTLADMAVLMDERLTTTWSTTDVFRALTEAGFVSEREVLPSRAGPALTLSPLCVPRS
jgi:transposase